MALLVFSGQAKSEFNPETALPEMGDTSGSYLSPIEEKRLGREFMRSFRRSAKIVDDPETGQYIQNLGQRLASHLKNQNYEYKFFVVDSPAINAFAAPGGYIGINSGLILATQSEGELASVLAHEIAHINQRHLARQFEQHYKVSLPTMAAIITAVILSGQDSDASYAAITTGIAGATQMQLNFTRSHEQEADRVGIQLLAGAGFDPYHMTQFFTRLQQLTQYGESGAPEFLRTHPLPLSRISDTQNRAEQFSQTADTSSLNYHLIRHRLQVLGASNPRGTAQEFAQRLEGQQYLNQHGLRYGYAYALLLNGELEKAKEQITQLSADDRERTPYKLLLAEIELAAQQYENAAVIYADALKIHPGNKWLTIRYAETLLQHQQPQRARELLYSIFEQREITPLIYKLMAQAEDALQNQVAAHAALAEYYYFTGFTLMAMEQIEVALHQYKPDDIQSAHLTRRLQELKQAAMDEAAQASR